MRVGQIHLLQSQQDNYMKMHPERDRSSSPLGLWVLNAISTAAECTFKKMFRGWTEPLGSPWSLTFYRNELSICDCKTQLSSLCLPPALVVGIPELWLTHGDNGFILYCWRSSRVPGAEEAGGYGMKQDAPLLCNSVLEWVQVHWSNSHSSSLLIA